MLYLGLCLTLGGLIWQSLALSHLAKKHQGPLSTKVCLATQVFAGWFLTFGGIALTLFAFAGLSLGGAFARLAFWK